MINNTAPSGGLATEAGMSAPPWKQQQVSLRGASAKEISRDALLQKVSHERELRNHARRSAASALFVQRVWRRYYVIKKVSEELHKEWEILANTQNNCKTGKWVSESLLRPFLFFVNRSSLNHLLQARNGKCISTCFTIVLQSINSQEPENNFCYLTVGTQEEKSTWLYQAQKLALICSSVLVECNEGENMVPLTALAMHLFVSLTDPKEWMGFTVENMRDADIAAKKLIRYMASGSDIYTCIRSYIMKQKVHFASQKHTVAKADDRFLITASAISLALRPFHAKLLADDAYLCGLKDASKQYFIFILTIPYLTDCLPPLLMPALKHESVLVPCLKNLLISKDKIFEEIHELERSKISCFSAEGVPYSGWALANIINLATECGNDSGVGLFVQGLDLILYLRATSCISEHFLSWLENCGQLRKRFIDDCNASAEYPLQSVEPDNDNKVMTSYIDLLKPVHQQWHLLKLLSMTKEIPVEGADSCKSSQSLPGSRNLQLLYIVHFYYYMLRIYSYLNLSVGSLAILNVLSFTPGFLVDLWEALEYSIFAGTDHLANEEKPCNGARFESPYEGVWDRKERRNMKENGSKWAHVLQKIAGKSTDADHLCAGNDPGSPTKNNRDAYECWDIESMRHGTEGISKDLSCMLHLFCAAYAHLLLVLDDIEFYEKQVPFVLEQQQRITAVLNTFVYNSFIQNSGHRNKSIADVAIRCLHLLYERDCRRRFCPSCLWVAPARKGRIPIVAAARAHEAAFSSLQSADASTVLGISSVLTNIPHVYPFEDRVQMFREFIKSDKASRRVVGEVSGPGLRSIEIIVRRDHIVEDGFRQLNFLGPKLRSCINVSFISESGLPEAGLDYGGLSKEFLTDLARAAFDPQYGLFTQTPTSERLLTPNMAARHVENGIDMIEFLGRVVGKALYEGILLDYSFSVVFVQKILGRYSFIDELSALDSELYRNLMYVKNFDGDFADLSLDFTVTEEIHGKRVVTALKADGKNVAVTNENKLQYVHAMADYKLNRQILPLANAFYRGLIDLISPSWLSLFNANEFNQLLSGGEYDFDVDDLRSNTRYTGGYSEGSRAVRLFWQVIREFKPTERCLLLKFVTSCSRAPLLGFKHLQPSFTVHKVVCDMPLWSMLGGQDVDRLPSASTCYNTLKLPTYKRATTLRNKLIYAINSNAGFELS